MGDIFLEVGGFVGRRREGIDGGFADQTRKEYLRGRSGKSTGNKAELVRVSSFQAEPPKETGWQTGKTVLRKPGRKGAKKKEKFVKGKSKVYQF